MLGSGPDGQPGPSMSRQNVGRRDTTTPVLSSTAALEAHLEDRRVDLVSRASRPARPSPRPCGLSGGATERPIGPGPGPAGGTSSPGRSRSASRRSAPPPGSRPRQAGTRPPAPRRGASRQRLAHRDRRGLAQDAPQGLQRARDRRVPVVGPALLNSRQAGLAQDFQAVARPGRRRTRPRRCWSPAGSAAAPGHPSRRSPGPGLVHRRRPARSPGSAQHPRSDTWSGNPRPTTTPTQTNTRQEGGGFQLTRNGLVVCGWTKQPFSTRCRKDEHKRSA